LDSSKHHRRIQVLLLDVLIFWCELQTKKIKILYNGTKLTKLQIKILPGEPTHERQYKHDKSNKGKNIHKKCIYQQYG